MFIDVHKKQKRILGPALNVPNVNAMLPIFYDKAEILRARLTDLVVNASGSERVDVAAWTSKCTMDIIGSAGLGVRMALRLLLRWADAMGTGGL